MESWSIPLAAVLLAFFAAAFRGLFGEAKEVKASANSAVSEAKMRTLRDVTGLMANEVERATEPAWGLDPRAFGLALGEDRERRARKATEEQWRMAMMCWRLLARVNNLEALESIGRLFCLVGLVSSLGYALLVLCWLTVGSDLLRPLMVLMWGAPFVVVVGVRAICEVVRWRIRSVQREIEEPWRV